MDRAAIKQAISRRIEHSEATYPSWTIGITQNPAHRKIEHNADGENTSYWTQWIATSLSDAKDIESYFINEKTMKGGTADNLVPGKITYVYIF